MHAKATVLALASLASASLLPAQPSFSNDNSDHERAATFPTVHDSAVQARRILNLEKYGTLSTIFPTTHSAENRPSDVGGTPIGLMDYFGDCEPDTGNPTLLAITIATSFKNVDAGSNITLSLRWHPPTSRPYSPAAIPRFSLIGHLEDLTEDEVKSQSVTTCFVKYHPDAATWLPGNRIHESKWVRLVVDEVYWIGGFGNVAYIGWIPVEEWKSVTKEEIEKCRLPGEKKHGWGPWMRSWFGLGAKDYQEILEL
ncbi:hypothetical protein BS50DRAFT_572115 [Corynespora cassiicola Philippines]|uniref:CREG-like beta-barrel domain-containing protein n=1 Tax=Corynespora cassiicola Philippines TaxID=1448308 RepID=A0A2T2NUG4_CORCC|nr:hypothetical protein BS50DRAFT_572115 [Corynespora cassiicola Philippines]